MIRIPVCFFCNNYDSETKCCPAYEQGIPDDILFSRKRGDKDCGNGVGFSDGQEQPRS